MRVRLFGLATLCCGHSPSWYTLLGVEEFGTFFESGFVCFSSLCCDLPQVKRLQSPDSTELLYSAAFCILKKNAVMADQDLSCTVTHTLPVAAETEKDIESSPSGSVLPQDAPAEELSLSLLKEKGSSKENS